MAVEGERGGDGAESPEIRVVREEVHAANAAFLRSVQVGAGASPRNEQRWQKLRIGAFGRAHGASEEAANPDPASTAGAGSGAHRPRARDHRAGDAAEACIGAVTRLHSRGARPVRRAHGH
jgi:hypothetical protein